jgi:hypothetical protein
MDWITGVALTLFGIVVGAFGRLALEDFYRAYIQPKLFPKKRTEPWEKLVDNKWAEIVAKSPDSQILEFHWINEAQIEGAVLAESWDYFQDPNDAKRCYRKRADDTKEYFMYRVSRNL